MASSKDVKMIDCTVPGCTVQINFSRRIKLCPAHIHHRDLCNCADCKRKRNLRERAARVKEYKEPYKPQNPWEIYL